MPKQSFKVCFCFKRIFRFRMAEPPNDVMELFKNYSDNSTIMTVDQLQKFLNEFQGETNVSKEDAQNIVNTQLNIFQRNKGLHLDAFFRYLLGDLNPAHIRKVYTHTTHTCSCFLCVSLQSVSNSKLINLTLGFSIAKYLTILLTIIRA